MFSSVHRWDDTRIFHKEASSLAKKYKIKLHAPAPFDYKFINNVHVYGLPKWTKKTDRLLIHIILLKRIFKSQAQIFHFHDPELLLTGLFIKLFLRKTVIYDVHEDYPKQVASVDWIYSPVKILISKFIQHAENLFSHLLDHFIVVTKPIQSRFPKGKTTLVQNYPLLFQTKYEKKTDGIYFVYVGDIREDRGIKLLCEAFNSLIQKSYSSNIYLVIAGRLSGSEHFNSEMRDLFLSKNIAYKGLVTYDKAMKLMAESHIGIIPSHFKKNYMESLPNKMFEYMYNELMLITTNIPHWEKIITDNKIGWTFQGESNDSLARIMEKSIQDKNELLKLGVRAKMVAQLKYNWNTEEIKLYNLYERLTCV